MKKMIVLILLIGLSGALAYASPIIGVPTEKVQSESGYTERLLLSEEQQGQSQCIINKIGNSYYWVSRGNVKMLYSRSGIYDVYFAEKGQGYVKIEDGKKYIEHAHIGLKTVTYWGKIQ